MRKHPGLALLTATAALFAACGGSSSSDGARDAGCCGDGSTLQAPDATADGGAQDGPSTAIEGGQGSRPDAGGATPTPCPAGDSSTDIGVWREVSPAAFHNPSNMQNWSVAINPQDESIFASAGNVTNGGSPPIGTGVYKSTDCGDTWSLVSTGRGAADLATGDPWALLIDPVTPATMYVDNGYGDNDTLFQSTNGGVDWAPLDIDPCGVTAPPFAQAIAMDPNDHLHLALTYHETCATTGTKTCSVALPTTPMCLSQTTDGGRSWKYINGPTAAQGVKGWQEAASLRVLGANSYLLLTPNNGGWLTRDGGATWVSKIATYNIYGSYAGSAHLASDGTLYVGVANVGVYYSRADTTHLLGDLWTLIPGSPAAAGSTAFVDDGVDIYMSNGGFTNGHPYYWAPLSNTAIWTNMTPPTDPGAANQYAYDPAHHLIYAASISAGLWRLHSR